MAGGEGEGTALPVRIEKTYHEGHEEHEEKMGNVANAGNAKRNNRS